MTNSSGGTKQDYIKTNAALKSRINYAIKYKSVIMYDSQNSSQIIGLVFLPIQ